MTTTGASAVGIALLFPDLLGTYGDSGNAVILAQRLRWRGIAAEIHTVRSGDPVPTGCQIYVVGGGEDLPQYQAARQLGAGAGAGAGPAPLTRAVEAGAVVLAVCAGVQILGRSFVGPEGREAPGLGLLDCTTERGQGPRAVGEMVVDPVGELGLPALTGYENHGGVTRVGTGASALGDVRQGVGNGDGSGTDGVWGGRVLGTYLHGPVLARNPALADLLLAWAVGELDPLDDAECDDLRRERFAAAGSVRRRGRARRLIGALRG